MLSGESSEGLTGNLGHADCLEVSKGVGRKICKESSEFLVRALIRPKSIVSIGLTTLGWGAVPVEDCQSPER